jgi:hypothetical protein
MVAGGLRAVVAVLVAVLVALLATGLAAVLVDVLAAILGAVLAAGVVGVVDNRGDRDVPGVECLEPLVGDVGVLAHDLALESGLQRCLLLYLADGGGKHGGLASTEAGLQSEGFKSAWCETLSCVPTSVTYHAGGHGGETVKALTDGLTTLLLRENVILLLLGIGEARAVVVVRTGAVAATGRRVERVHVGRHCL